MSGAGRRLVTLYAPLMSRTASGLNVPAWIEDNASHWWASGDIAASMQTWTDRIAGETINIGQTTSVESSDPTVNTEATPKRLEHDGVDDRLLNNSPSTVSDFNAADDGCLIIHLYAPTTFGNLTPVWAVMGGSSDMFGIIAVSSGTSIKGTFNGNASSYNISGGPTLSGGERVTYAVSITGNELEAAWIVDGVPAERPSKLDITGDGTVIANRLSTGVNWFAANPVDEDVTDLLIFDTMSIPDEATLIAMDAEFANPTP